MADNRRATDLWRQRRPAGTTGPKGTGRGRSAWLWGLALLLAMAGGLVGWMLLVRPPPRPLFLSIAVTEYRDRAWPANPWAGQDSEALRRHFGADSVQAFQSQERELILRELGQLADRSRDEGQRPVAVHLSALAVARDRVPYLLPGDARPDQPLTWIALEDLLQPLRKMTAPRLLVLDLRPVVDARLGVLADEVSGALDATLRRLEQANDLPFPVLVVYHPGGVPVSARELRQGLFGFGLARGLAGAADGWNEARALDGRVSALEWAAYGQETAERTGFGLKATRYGPTADFPLLPVPATGVPGPPELAEADPYPEWLTNAWRERDRWRQEGAHLRLPRTFRHLEATALWAEQLWLGGGDIAAQNTLAEEVRELQARKKAHAEAAPAVRSVAQARQLGLKHEAEAAKALAPLLARFKTLIATPAEKTEKVESPRALQQALWDKPPEPAPYDSVASAVLAAALEFDEPTPDQLQLLASTLEGFRPPPPHAEAALLRFLGRLSPNVLKLWEPGTVRLVLRTTLAAEQAAAADPRSLPWVRQELAEADALRRAAVFGTEPKTGLVRGESTARQHAREKLAEATRKYVAVRDAANALGQGFAQLDEARSVLPALAAFVPPDELIAQEVDKLWSAAVAEAGALQKLLAPPTEPALPDAEKLNQHALNLKVRLAELTAQFVPAPSAGPRELARWLEWPGWPAAERSRLVTRLANGSSLLAREVLRKWPTAPSSEPQRSAPAGPDPAAALRRARRALDLLRLVNDPELPALEKDFAAAGGAAGSGGRLAQEIRRGWAERLPQRYRAAPDLRQQAALGWAVQSFDLPALPRSGDPFPRDAEAVLRARLAREFHHWLGESRYQAEANAARALEGNAAALDYAKALDNLAREHLDWPP